MSLSRIQSIIDRLHQDRTVDRIKVRKVGSASLATDGHDTIERQKVSVVVKAAVTDEALATYAAIVRVFAAADPITTRKSWDLPITEAQLLAAADCAKSLADAMGSAAPSAADLSALRDEAKQAVMAAFKAKTLKPQLNLGLGDNTLAACDHADCEVIAAAVPGAAARLAKAAADKAAAEKAKADKKAAQAAALSKPIAKASAPAPLKSLSAMAWNG